MGSRGTRNTHSQDVRLEVQSRTQFTWKLQDKIYDNKKPVGVSSLLIIFFQINLNALVTSG